jgi:hypothetical protein
MKKFFSSVAAAVFIVLTVSIVSFAQNNRTNSTVKDAYVISAKAGGVNYIEGSVAVTRKAGKNGFLIKGATLEIGDKVSTGANGKAEILLNPGSFVRLAENSTFEFVNTSLDNLELKINGGSAMLEVFADDDFKVVVVVPNSRFYVVQSGVYRVDVQSSGSAKFAVWKGKAQVGDANATAIKGGREATVNAGQVSIVKFDRDDKGELEMWSKSRSKELAKLTNKIERDGLRNTLLSSYNNRGWDVYNSFGLWIHDASFGYCFLPFGYGWSSPYGYSYGRSLWYYRMPTYIYNQPIRTNNGGGNNTGSNNTGGNNTGGSNNGPVTNRSAVPPFVRMQPGNGVVNDSFPNGRRNDPTIFDNPVRSSPSAPPQQSVPVPTTVRSVERERPIDRDN